MPVLRAFVGVLDHEREAVLVDVGATTEIARELRHLSRSAVRRRVEDRDRVEPEATRAVVQWRERDHQVARVLTELGVFRVREQVTDGRLEPRRRPAAQSFGGDSVEHRVVSTRSRCNPCCTDLVAEGNRLMIATPRADP